MTSRTLLASDLSYQSYRATAVHRTLTSRGIFTGGLYGFLVSMAKQVKDSDATDYVVCLDLPPYKRSAEYPEYKQLRRKRSDDDLHELHMQSKELILELIDVLGVPVLGVPGFESDDCIAHLVRTYRHRFDSIYAASNDSDLFQLFDNRNFKCMTGSGGFVDWRLLDAPPWSCTPEEFKLALAMEGTHNDVVGIPQVGPVTAMRAVREPAIMRKYREQWGDLIDRNLRLIELPHRDFPAAIRLPRRSGRGFDPRLLYRWCARFDIEVRQSMVTAFEKVL